MITKITSSFGDVSADWILTGKEYSVPEHSEEINETRPHIPARVAAGTLSGIAESIKSHECQELPLISVFPDYSTLLVMVERDAVACADVDKSLTSHVARHTFAIWALNNGAKMETVSKMLGHNNIRTTQIYAKVLNKSVEPDYLMLDNSLRKKEEGKQPSSNPIRFLILRFFRAICGKWSVPLPNPST